MTADLAHPSRQESSRRNHDAVVDESEEFCLKEGQVLHETRAQKQAVKCNPRDEHADVIKDSTGEIESDFPGGSVGVSTRSSTRPSKRAKISSSPPYKSVDQENKDDHNIASSNSSVASTAPNGKKRKAKAKRQWESWGTKGKDAFFEALHEFGKDFDKIQSYIAAKHKRRGDQLALIKNKDQVRHFYYRTLNKISKYVPPEKEGDESDPQRKTVTELNSLICYGELRKKMCGLNDKHGKKLSELISRGNTTIRYNGRNFKIKAPVCRALKKLHPAASSGNSEDNETHLSTVPSKLFVELTPYNNATWCAVQRMAKNPRLKTTVLPNKPLGSILAFLSKKWPVMSNTSNKLLKICILVPEGFYSPSKECRNSPMQTCNHSDVGAVIPEVSQGVSTENKVDEARAVVAVSEDVSLTVESPDLISDLSETASAHNMVIDNGMEADPKGLEPSCLKNSDSGNDCDANLELISKPGESTSNPNSPGSKPTSNIRSDSPTCWTADNCGNVTFSSIYYKLGCPSSCKLKLQYKWQNEEASSQSDSTPLKKLVNIASVEVARLKETKKNEVAVSKSLSSTSSTVCTYPTSRNTRIAPKTTEILPLILPSVSMRAPSTPVVNEFPPPSRPIPKPRKQQRKPVAIAQRTLLPRPMAPPGAVAVSFIPQPGQEVGTILASGVSTVSTATSPNVSSLQSRAASPTSVTMSVSLIPSPSASSSGPLPSDPLMSSRQVMATADSPSQSRKEASTSGSMPMDSSSSYTQQQSSVAGLVVVPSSFTTSSSIIDLGFSETGNMPSSLTVDPFMNSTESLSASSDTLDSIIGLALGTALNDKEADVSLVTVRDDLSNLIVASQTLSTINSTLSMSSSAVQVEELNSGISGGPPITLATSSSAQDCNEVSQQDLVLPAAPTLTSSTLPSLRIHSPDSEPQWLNGEAPDISFGSLLDKVSTSPKKQSKSTSFEDLSGSSESKSSSQYSLLPSHHLMDADTAMHAMMDESSVDFIRNFRDLASKLDGNVQTSYLSTSRVPMLNFVASGNTETSEGSLDTILEESLTFKNILSRENSGQVGL